MSVPVAVTKIALMPPTQNVIPDDAREPRHLLVRMRRGEGDAQPRRAVRHGRRPDRGDEKAFRLEQPLRRERRLLAAEQHRHDGALRLGQAGDAGEGARLGERQRRKLGLAGDDVERRDAAATAPGGNPVE